MRDDSQKPHNPVPPNFVQGLPSGEQAGDRINDYTLVDEIGEGGMGTVWRAEQEKPVRRQVALKIIKLGMDTRQVVARFEAERQALALMDHPSIAKVYDAGVMATGRPYFVMELVQGAPITEFCDAEGLPTARRLELFQQVCMAVQHAHQKGILHRDLKPSNILVTKVDGVPQPKVIDFGIAKAMEKPLTDSSLATEAFQVVGTPEYMPPEQASGRDVDTRADVYSLGVVLYEMLTGEPPFDRDTGGLDELAKLLQRIHEETPAKPSTRVSDLGVGLEEVARARGSQPNAFARALRGDLDWIVMKALEKDRERRYATALDMAEDVGRHLAHEPVVASPPSTAYRLRKFVRRNRLTVGSASVVLSTLIGSTIALGLLYSRTLTSEARANQQAETSRQALNFLTEMFEVSNPSQARGETVTAREILDRGAGRIERELAGQPEIQSTLLATMGDVYSNLGLYGPAERLSLSSARMRRELYGEDDPEALRLSTLVANIWTSQSRLEEAEKMLRKSLERQRRVLGEAHEDVLDSRLLLSDILRRRSQYDEAEGHAEESLEIAQRALGEDHEVSLNATNLLGLVYLSAGRYEEADEQLRRALRARKETLGGNHPETLNLSINLGEVSMRMGRFEEAEILFTEASETTRRVYGDKHPSFVTLRSKLGLLYDEQARWKEAEETYREVLGIQRNTIGDDHLDTLLSLNTLGAVLANQGRYDEAEAYYLDALQGLRRDFGDESEHTMSVIANMAMLYLHTNSLEKAEAWGRQAYEGSVAIRGEDHPTSILYLENLGNVYFKRGAPAEAAAVLEEVLVARRRALGNEHPAVTRTLVNVAIVRSALSDGQGARAAREELLERTLNGLGFDYASVAEQIEVLARGFVRSGQYGRAITCLQEILRIRIELLGSDHPSTLMTMLDVLRVSIELKRWPELETLGKQCYEAHLRVLGSEDPNTAECVRRMAQAYEDRGEEALAEEWRAKQRRSPGDSQPIPRDP